MKTLRSKSLMSILYAVILSIPMVSILSRVIYVQTNKNAYQSYSGQNQTEIKNYDELPPLNETIYSYLNYQTEFYNTGYLPITDFEYINTNLTIVDVSNVAYARYYANKTLYLWDSNYSQITNYSLSGSNYINFSFKLVGYSQDLTNVGTMFSYIDNQSYNYIDNVFDYSVNQLVDENNFGELNFFEWFSSWLLTDSQYNMLYVRFANWYLNYALLVSLMQIIFLCLMWFVNFSRRLLERGMNYDW